MTAITDPMPGHNRKRAAEVTMILRRGLMAVLVAAGVMVVPGVARAATIHTVCTSGCDFTSVNAAVSASSARDGIEVMPGTYPEQVVVTKPLTSSEPPGRSAPGDRIRRGANATVTIAADGRRDDAQRS